MSQRLYTDTPPQTQTDILSDDDLVNRRNRRRPKSYHNRSTTSVNTYHPEDFKDDEFKNTSLLDDAAEHQDFNAIKEGLKFALGTEEGDSHWFPMTQKDTHNDTETKNDAIHLSVPKIDASTVTKKKFPGLVVDTSAAAESSSRQPGRLSPNPFGDYLHPSNVPTPKVSNFASAGPSDLEQGFTPTISIHPEFPDSPAKISNIITRVSDRIAGTGAGATLGAELSSKKSRDDASIRSWHSSRNSSRSDLELPYQEELHKVNKSRDTDVETVPYDESPVLSRTTSRADVGSPEFDQENNRTFRSVHAPTAPDPKSVAFENEPVSKKARPTSMNVSKLWQSDTSTMYLFGNTLKIFSPQSVLRQKCHYFLSLKATNTFFLVLLVLQTVFLSIRQWNPKKMKGYVASGNNWIDYLLIAINVIFTLEMAAKVVAYGFYDDKAMFQELNLPYPENEIKVKLLKGNSVRQICNRVLQRFGMGKRPARNFYDQTSKYEEVELQDLPNSSSDCQDQHTNGDWLSHKYDTSSHHAPPGLGLKSTNTFVKPPFATNIDMLQLRRAYIRNSWHRIDFLSVVSFWISLLLSINRYDVKHNIMLFRALSCLRILRLCNLTTGTSTILTSLKHAVPQLIDVCIFIACFGIFFSILGVQSFKSSFTRHCVWTNPEDPTDTWTNSDSYCGSYLSSEGHAMPYIFRNGQHSSSIKGFRCPVNSQCVSGENPYQDTVSFDNIFNSLELVFVIMTANTFTDLMYYTMDTDGLVASLFFIACLFIMTVWLLNIFVAIIVTSFNLTRSGSSAAEARQVEGVYGPVNAPVSMHKELIEELKRKSMWLRIYYKTEFLFPLCIIADMIAQCTRTANESRTTDHTLYRFESAFTALFFGEIIVRFLLYLPNWRTFFRLRRNVFDLFLAVITSIIIIQPVKSRLGQAYYWLTVFQIMRCYRIILISRFTRSLWLKIFGNIKQLFDLTAFLFLLTYLTSIIYARFFEGSITEDEASNEGSDFDFQTLPNTFVGLYTITSTENWTSILYPLQGYQKNLAAKVFTGIFLIGWFFISNFVILNIFIAVIANTLIVPETEKKRRQLLQFIQNITESIHSVDNESGALSRFKNKFFNRKGSKEQLQMAVVSLLLSGTGVKEFLDTNASDNHSDDDIVENLPRNRFKRFFKVNFKRAGNNFNNPFKTRTRKVEGLAAFDPTNYAKDLLKDRSNLIDAQNKYLQENPRYNKVFWVMGPRHKIRRFCQRIVNSSHGERIDGVEPHKRVSDAFTIFMFLSTLVLVIAACYLTPLIRSNVQDRNGLYGWTFWLDFGLICIFTTEGIIRVLADGFCFTPNAYCRSSWNIIDLIVLFSLWLEFVAYLKHYGELSRFIRGFKALRALRILTISETAKNNFHNTMISGIGNIVSAGLMSLCLLVPFSIWGLNIFNGRLGYCLDGESTFSQCVNEYTPEVFNWNVVSPNAYVEPLLNFNKFSSSFSALFEITSLEGWVDLLVNVMASTGVGTVPQPFATPFNGFFVILFNFVGIVFILTLFISVIIHNYSLSTGRAYMTIDQRSWYQVKQFLLQVRPSKRKLFEDQTRLQKFCSKLTVERDPIWNGCLNFVLFLHVLALLLEQFPTKPGMDVFRFVVFILASLLFTTNALMTMIAIGFATFVRNKWLMFNAIVSIGALVTTIIGTQVSELSAYTNINKLFLVGSLSFFIPRSDRLSQFLKFASASLPDLFSLLFTWLVLFLLYAIALNQVFGTTRIGPNGTGNINVRSVPKALILLFRCSFGEGWNYIMDDYKVEEPYCFSVDGTTHTDCGNKQYAYVLFMSWNIISMYIFSNMFVSLILDSFSYIMNKGDYAKLIERGEIRKFKRQWQKFDPQGTGYIEPKDLPKLLHSLDGALSFHFYHGSLQIPVLCHKWFRRNDPQDPYDITVNFKEIESTMSSWDIEKIRERRQAYEMFIEEAMVSMELNNDPGISFRRILLQLPLYKTFDTSTCLNLIDFLERRLLLQKVKKRLNRNKVYETITAYIVRWKYLQAKRHGMTEVDNLDLEKALRRRSYLSGERSPLDQQYFDNEFERNFGDQESKNYDDDAYSTGSDDDEDDSKYRSGIYVPKSPLHTNKNKQSTSAPPKMFLEVSDASRMKPTVLSFGDLAPGSTTSLLETEAVQSTESLQESGALISMEDVRDGIQDSQWIDSLRDMEKK